MSKIQDFFDSLAPKWDEGEIYPLEQRKALIDQLGIAKGDRILDLACGTGIITPLLSACSGSHVDALDLSPKMIERAKEKYAGDAKLHFEVGDFLTYPFDKKYDWVVVYNAYPHFMDVDAFKKKAFDVLKEHGHLAILHSMSASALSEHHKHVDPSLFREIPLFIEEAKKYEPEFEIKTVEETDHVVVVLEKK